MRTILITTAAALALLTTATHTRAAELPPEFRGHWGYLCPGIVVDGVTYPDCDLWHNNERLGMGPRREEYLRKFRHIGLGDIMSDYSEDGSPKEFIVAVTRLANGHWHVVQTVSPECYRKPGCRTDPQFGIGTPGCTICTETETWVERDGRRTLLLRKELTPRDHPSGWASDDMRLCKMSPSEPPHGWQNNADKSWHPACLEE